MSVQAQLPKVPTTGSTLHFAAVKTIKCNSSAMMLLPLLLLLLPRIADFLSLSDSLSCLLRVASWLVGWWVPVLEMLAQCQMPTRAQDLLSLTPSPPSYRPILSHPPRGGRSPGLSCSHFSLHNYQCAH